MDVGLPKQFDKRLGSKTTKMQQVVVVSSRQKELRRALPEFAVLSEAGYETKACAQGAGVRTRMLDGAVHPDEHGVQEKREERLRKDLLQANEQLCFW